MNNWREGARSGHPTDVCPVCGRGECIFASDFKAMGKKSVRVCLKCNSVSLNGVKQSDLDVYQDVGRSA